MAFASPEFCRDSLYIQALTNTPPVVQPMNISYLALLCGQQDDLHELPRMAIPIIRGAISASRTDEIVLFEKPPDLSKAGAATKLLINPVPPPSPRSGDLVLEVHSHSKHSTAVHLHGEVERDYITEIPLELTGFVFSAISSTSDSFPAHLSGIHFGFVAHRLGALDHSHETPGDAEGCGRLRFAFCAYKVLQPGDSGSASMPILLNTERDYLKPPILQPYFPRVYYTNEEALHDMHTNTPLDLVRDMAIHRDDYRVGIDGLASIRIIVERMFLKEDESDSDSDSVEDDIHRFVDVIYFRITDDTKDDDGVSLDFGRSVFGDEYEDQYMDEEEDEDEDMYDN